MAHLEWATLWKLFLSGKGDSWGKTPGEEYTGYYHNNWKMIFILTSITWKHVLKIFKAFFIILCIYTWIPHKCYLSINLNQEKYYKNKNIFSTKQRKSFSNFKILFDHLGNLENINIYEYYNQLLLMFNWCHVGY